MQNILPRMPHLSKPTFSLPECFSCLSQKNSLLECLNKHVWMNQKISSLNASKNLFEWTKNFSPWMPQKQKKCGNLNELKFLFKRFKNYFSRFLNVQIFFVCLKMEFCTWCDHSCLRIFIKYYTLNFPLPGDFFSFSFTFSKILRILGLSPFMTSLGWRSFSTKNWFSLFLFRHCWR